MLAAFHWPQRALDQHGLHWVKERPITTWLLSMLIVCSVACCSIVNGTRSIVNSFPLLSPSLSITSRLRLVWRHKIKCKQLLLSPTRGPSTLYPLGCNAVRDQDRLLAWANVSVGSWQCSIPLTTLVARSSKTLSLLFVAIRASRAGILCRSGCPLTSCRFGKHGSSIWGVDEH